MTIFKKKNTTTPKFEIPGLPVSRIGYIKLGTHFLPINSIQYRNGVITSRVRVSGVYSEPVTGLIQYYDHEGNVVLGDGWDQTATEVFLPRQLVTDTLVLTHNIREVPSQFSGVKRVSDLKGLPEILRRTWSLQVY